MADHSSHTVCVIDNGLFVEFAVRLAKDFGKVYYHSPWESAFPTTNRLIVGAGLPGVERVESIWPIINKVDLFVFPDICYADLQEYLVSIGKRVWGSRRGEELEQYRDFCKQVLASVDLPVGRYALLTGVSELRDYLKDNDNQYVKINRTRGDFETFKAENLRLVEPRLVEIEQQLGAKKDITQFIAEDEITDAVEVGYDGYTVDGQFPTRAMSGIEIKSCGYVGRMQNYSMIPAPLREVNTKMANILEQYQYRNMWCAETRITREGKPFVIDPCTRAGSPPSEVALLMYTNLADIMWHGAEGFCVDPVPAAEWAAEIMLHSDWAARHWQPVDFPPELRDNVKLYFPTVIDGRYYTVPVGHDLPAIGAVAAVGATLEEAINNAKKVAEQVQGYYVEAPLKAMDDAQAEITKLREFGYDL